MKIRNPKSQFRNQGPVTILRKKSLTFCFFIVISFFINGPVHGYVLQGLHILDLMVEQLGEARSLFVSQELIFYRLVSQVDIDSDEPVTEYQAQDNTETDLPADQTIQVEENVTVEETLELEETLRFIFSHAFRSDAKSLDSERIYVVSGDKSLTIVDGNIVPAAANRFDLYKDILLFICSYFIRI